MLNYWMMSVKEYLTQMNLYILYFMYYAQKCTRALIEVNTLLYLHALGYNP